MTWAALFAHQSLSLTTFKFDWQSEGIRPSDQFGAPCASQIVHEGFPEETPKIATVMGSLRFYDASDVEPETSSCSSLFSELGEVLCGICQLSEDCLRLNQIALHLVYPAFHVNFQTGD